MTVRTTGDVGEAVREAMRIERLRIERARRPRRPNPAPDPVEVEAIQEPEVQEDPESVEVQEEVTTPEVEVVAEVVAESAPLKRPSDKFGGKIAWYEYRLANGYTEEELEGLGRDALRDLSER